MLNKSLMVSTSGVRGIVGNGLNPADALRYAAAYGTLLGKCRVVIGRDSRPSGEIFQAVVTAGLRGVGVDVIDIGIVPTPTVEIAITGLKAAGGICITASHNPAEWNALKFFDKKGEFISKSILNKVKKLYTSDKFKFVDFRRMGNLTYDNSWIDRHIDRILRLKVINKSRVKRAGFKIVVDAINGAGSYALPELLEKMGVKVIRLNCDGDGNFVHSPEPIPANLKMLSTAVKRHKADLGMACDPDADRLALVDERGHPLGEELTLALAVRLILSKKRGKVVINLSTSRVTEDAAREWGAKVIRTAVGEANVVAGIRKHKAVIGGEGNGGVIYPSFHSGRDALVGAAFIVSLMAESKKSLASLAGTLPIYYNIKSKAALPANFDYKISRIEKLFGKKIKNFKIDRRDGLRFDFKDGWFQIRISNTEPIYRSIIETNSQKLSRSLKREVASYLK
jgi:phosphomannomutase